MDARLRDTSVALVYPKKGPAGYPLFVSVLRQKNDVHPLKNLEIALSYLTRKGLTG
jgi:hypothetical protein